MKRIIIVLILSCSALLVNAAEIKFLVNPEWGAVLKKAKEENKIIFFDAYAVWCGPCKKMDSDVYTDPAVAEYYNANFINVKYDMEQGEGKMLAEKFSVTAYPSLLFVSAEGDILHKGLGYKDPIPFVALGKDAINPATQYASVKAAAINLSPKEFIKFAIAAQESGETDYDDIARKFLSKQKDVLGDNDLISIVMKGITYLPDEKVLEYIVNNKQKIAATNSYKPEEIQQRINALTLAYAVHSNTNTGDGSVDMESVKAMVNKYAPQDALFLFNYFKMQYSLDNGDPNAAGIALNEIMSAPIEKVSFEQISNLLMAFGPAFEKNGLDKYLTQLDNYVLSPTDSGNAYMKDLVKAVVYLKLKDQVKFKAFTDKILASKDTPEDVKTQLRDIASKQGQ